MGIRGLETFTDRIYQSEDRQRVFEELLLTEFKLVIDGNQFAYVISSLFKQGQYGGNYDQFYDKLKLLLIKLKPSIELFIFDGAKESIEKSRNRLEQRIARIANLETDENKEPMTKDQHQAMLKEYPSLFNRNILYNLLNELKIEYKMCVGLADHVIAVYANGHNPKGQKFTVMSKASFFNVYKLDKGYLSTKYALKIFQNLDEIDTVKFPIFRLDKLMEFYHLESHRTWIYFCILLGNNDDVELKRNMAYLREFKIDTRGGNLDHLIAHCKLEERHLLETNFNQIRVTYQFKQQIALKKIDALVDLFEMKDTGYKFNETGAVINDYDRIFLTIKLLNCFHINCLVEDPQEDSVFAPAVDFVHSIYSILLTKSSIKFSQIDEFIRTKNPSKDTLIDSCPITADMFNKVLKENRYFNFLLEIEKKLTQFKIVDNLTVLFVSLIVWQNWLDKKLIKLDTDECDTRLKKLNSDQFLNSIITNFCVLSLKCDTTTSTGANDLTQMSLFKEACKKDSSKNKEILELYEKCLLDKECNVDEYYGLDVKLIHRINEFQGIYYMLSALCKLNESKFEVLEPSRFLNCFFCVNYIKMMIFDENNNQIENEYFKINEMVKSCPVTDSLYSSLTTKVDFCRRLLNRNGLKELLQNLKI